MNRNQIKRLFTEKKSIAGIFHKGEKNIRYLTVEQANTYSFTVPYHSMLPSTRKKFKQFMKATDLIEWLDPQA